MKTNNEGKYIYGIINTDKSQEFGHLGIGGRADMVYTLGFKDIAVVVSSSPIVKYPVFSDNVMAHQKVLEEVMKEFTILPVRFCTIAEQEEAIREKVLKARYEEFKNLLFRMQDKVEFGVRAMWANVSEIFEEIAKENEEIKRLKEELLGSKSKQKSYAGRMKIGEMVQKALGVKKEKEKKAMLKVLSPIAENIRENRILGDRNFLNAAFLLKKQREEEFDKKMAELEKQYSPRVKFIYIGPVPICNFVEIVIKWE